MVMLKLLSLLFILEMVQISYCHQLRNSKIYRREQPQLKSPNQFNFADSNNEFALDLYNKIVEGKESDFIFSPYSISSIMGVLQIGARNSTYSEIQQAMHFPPKIEDLLNGYSLSNVNDENESSKSKSDSTSVTLSNANRIFLKSGFLISSDFTYQAKKYFSSPVEQLNFSQGPKAAKIINNWVATKTNNKIERLVEPSLITNDTKILIVNAMHFHGAWENKFDTGLTKKKIFYNGGVVKNGVSVDTMFTENFYPVTTLTGLNAKAITFSYEKKRYRMILIVPNEKDGLETVEKGLKEKKFSAIYEEIRNSNVKNILLSLPKFRLDSTHDLSQQLKKLNIQKLFNEKDANLEGIVSNKEEKLYVSKFIQKSFLNVEEKGSEAGAATFVSLFTPLTLGPIIEDEIIVDKPFMGFIFDTKSQTVLFVFRKSKF